jgi:hypothetical protein
MRQVLLEGYIPGFRWRMVRKVKIEAAQALRPQA